MKITIIILSRDRPLQLSDMVDSIWACTPKDKCRIIICDNASTQPEMLTLLKRLENDCVVIRNKDNLLFEGLNPGLRMVRDKFFVISDPDIVLNPRMPKGWQNTMIDMLKRTDAAKVGVALRTDYRESPYLTKHLKHIEKDHWQETIDAGIQEPCYRAAIDTTFAMYRSDTFSHWEDGRRLSFEPGRGLLACGVTTQFYRACYQCPIRIAGNFLAEHTGWYVHPKYYPDMEYYRRSCKQHISTSLDHTGYIVDLVRSGEMQKKLDEIDRTLPKGFGPGHPKWNVPSFRAKWGIIMKFRG